MKLPGLSVPCAEPASFVSELSSASDTQNICLANFEARWSTIADTAKGALHRVLSDCIRRLYIEVHNAASVYGYFDCDSAVRPLRYPSGRQKFSEKPQPREETTETTTASAEHVGRHSSVRPGVVGSSAPQPVGPGGLLCSKVWWLPRFTWLKGASGISSAVAAGAVTVLLSRSSCAQFVIAATAMFAFAVVASCVIVWGQLELSVRRSSRRIRQLLTDMNLQHKFAGEILRWIQELEVTFKAFPGALAKKSQRAADAPPSASPCRNSGGQAPYDTSGQFQEVSVIGPPHCQGLPCCQNEGKGEKEWGQLRPNGLRSNVPCAWHLRIRLYQVLDWQQRIFCYLYEDVVRREPGSQLAWKSQISQGPWRRAEINNSGSYQFDSSLRALKEMTAKSWLLQSRLLGGIQVALRQVSLSTDSRLLRDNFAVKRRVNSSVKAFSSPTPKGTLTRHTSRVLKQALLESQQHYVDNSCSKSLREEINQAENAGEDGGGNAPGIKDCLRRLGGSNYTSFSTTNMQRRKRAQESTTSVVAIPAQGASGNPKRCIWIWSFCKASVIGLLGGYVVLAAVADGIRALWWVFKQLYRLEVAVSAADQVSGAAANALRTILEEDWASCPVLLPQPRWSEWVRTREAPCRPTDAVAESLKLTHWAVSPPATASQYSGTLCRASSYKHRSALASMSRNVAASLALLRLPAQSSCSHLKCPENDMSVQGRPGTACRPGQHSVDSGSTVCLTPMNQHTSPEERQEEGDAHLFGFLHLILRHLRVASEEGEKLEKSLRLNREKLEGFKTCDVTRSSEAAPVQPAERETASEETEQPLQPTADEPVQCLEVYTAVGQDSITNKRRFEEEEGVKEAFAEDDPAVRERSQITLKELELRLKRKEEEQKCIPQVLKELSVIAFDNADGSNCGGTEDRAVVRVVRETRGEACGFSAAHSSSVPSPNEKFSVLEGVQENTTCLSTSVTDADVISKDIPQQGIVGVARVNAENTVLEAESYPEETLRDIECLDNDQVAFRIRQQKLKGCSAGSVSFSRETLVTQSLISQLRGVLKRQKRTPSGGHDMVPSTAALGTTPGTNEPDTFGDSLADEEWSACDVVEGPSCAADAPTWVAAPPDLGDSEVDDSNGQKGTST